jgi:hypothetical protein
MPDLYLLYNLRHSDGREVKIAVQQTVTDVDQVKRPSSNLISADCPASPISSGNQLRDSIYKWLSPPDPSTNHNIACGTRHKKMASWFFQGSIFQDWKSTGSLLWVHGKRSPHPLPNLTPTNSILYYSRFWQKRPLVCPFLVAPLRGD